MLERRDTTKWLANVQPCSNAILRLFCFPYAGGSASIFHNWQYFLPKGVEVYPLQLPGRGSRVRETPLADVPTSVEEMIEALLPFLNCDFAFFGHSMGALIAFELSRALRDRKLREPLRLFVSGREAPDLPDSSRLAYDLPDAEFVALLRTLNGTPSAILESREMLEFVLPILRADIKLVQQYRYVPGAPLSFPIKAYGGLRDEHAHRAGLARWSQHTSGEFALSMLQGGHFFLQESKRQFMSLLGSDLAGTIQTAGRSARFATL